MRSSQVKNFPLLVCLAGLLPGTLVRAAEPFELRQDDRVVLLGNTLIEREQRDGYWETALTRRYPGRAVTFRTLGWSGDTVFGHARAGFGTTADGFKHLTEHVLSVKPTVILVGYGANESFDGPAGLAKFTDGLHTLLDALASARARVVLLSPPRQEDLGRPLPDPGQQNRNLRLYADAIRDVARKRDLLFVDLYDLLGAGARANPPAPLTDNGIHLTARGYWRSAPVLAKGLGLAEARWRIALSADNGTVTVEGAEVAKVGKAPLRFVVTDDMLPLPLPPADPSAKAPSVADERLLRISQLPPGRYTLHLDGQVIVTATAAEWDAGVQLVRGPEFDQAEQLRRAIVEKNRLYFHRWRPQNETYLFGFRKHEQGQNAREIPQFDPLVEKQEQVIARLRVPVAHTYELKEEAK
jgi:lysophospholipase L1-like esterase